MPLDHSSDTRYPYTYACDYIRSLGPACSSGVALSRADASRIRQGIAAALGVDDAELAARLADHELALEADPAIIQQRVESLMAAMGARR